MDRLLGSNFGPQCSCAARSVTCSEFGLRAHSSLEKACQYHSTVFRQKEDHLLGHKLALSLVASQSCYELSFMSVC